MKIYFKSLKRDTFFWGALLSLIYFSYGLIEVAMRSASDFEKSINYCGTLVEFKVTHNPGRNGAVRSNANAYVQLNDKQLVKVFSVDYWKNIHNEIDTNIGAPICILALPNKTISHGYYILQITLKDKNLISLPEARERYLLPWGTYFRVLLWLAALFIILWRGAKLNRKKQ